MEKIKLSNKTILEIVVNGVHSSADSLRVGIVASSLDLLEVENLVTVRDNVKRIELLSESDEVLKIYSGYTLLTSIEKRKDVVIETKIEDDTEVEITSDVIYFTLRKENDTEARLASLEETVDVLICSALEV